MTNTTNRIRISVALALAIATSPAAFALTHTGGVTMGDLASVKVYDASNPAHPVLTRETEVLLESGPFAFSHDALYVASGAQVRRYDRRDLAAPTSVWTSSRPILAVADGPQRAMLLVSDAEALTLVSFPDGGAPTAIWTFAIDGSGLGSAPGRTLIRDGNRAFVADTSIPGLRVVSIDAVEPPASIATYASTDGVVRDISLWGRKLTLAADAGIAVVTVSEGDEPTLQRVGAFATQHAPSRVDANSRFAFFADGQDLRVLDTDPASANFLSEPVDAWFAPADIKSVRLDKGERAYVLVQGGYEILDLGSYGGR